MREYFETGRERDLTAPQAFSEMICCQQRLRAVSMQRALLQKNLGQQGRRDCDDGFTEGNEYALNNKIPILENDRK